MNHMIRKKNPLILALAGILVLVLTACAYQGPASTPVPAATQTPGGDTASSAGATGGDFVGVSTISVKYDDDDLETGWNSADTTLITLAGDSAAVEGSGATAQDGIVTITAAGTYEIRGILDDGQIIVDTEDEHTVRLILNGADITCSDSAPIYVMNADKTVITLAEGTANTLTDGESYALADPEVEEPNAALFSKDDLTINGSGSLSVNANYNNAIQSKDDLMITGGTITVNAVSDGIKGKDSIVIGDGDITITAGGDGIASNNEEDAEKGYVAVEGGTLHITAGSDGIQAGVQVLISGGDIAITSGGGSANSSTASSSWGQWGSQSNQSSEDTASAKGVKAASLVQITGGTLTIDSSDDAIHCNDDIIINAGTITIASGDDGIHADADIEINGGDITITKCYEGIEGAQITINEGNFNIVSGDDGLNTAGGNDGSSINGRPGQNQFASSGSYTLYINGGYIVVNAGGDGLDINGPIYMSDGTVIVNGPTDNANGALDYDQEFVMDGGFLVAAGSSGMAQAPGSSSAQYAVMLNFSSTLSADTMIHIQSEDGEDILTFVPQKQYQSVVLSSPALKKGQTYTVYTGGSSTGTVADGLYTGGEYSGGAQYTTFTVSDVLTTVGQSGGFGGPSGGFDRPGGRR